MAVSLKNLLFSYGLLTGMLMLCTPAMAENAENQPPITRVAPMDANKDGVVDRQEFLDAQSRRFKRLDKDEDGRLTPEEQRPARDNARIKRIIKNRGK